MKVAMNVNKRCTVRYWSSTDVQLNDSESRSPLLHVVIRDDAVDEVKNERLQMH